MSYNETRFRVRYAETDQMGIVYHANYLIWMELGRVEYCRARGLRYRDIEEQDGIRMAVVEAKCRFVSPARYDDEIIVRTEIEKAHQRLVRFGYRILHAEENRLLAEGTTTHLFLDRNMRPARLPEKYLSCFGIVR
ncbi:MAG: acyl-CoA thioesterase [Bryobacteraceae bacterium]|nr:acyl-CoA thioesterase [Bryobacteraceae bacterium]